MQFVSSVIFSSVLTLQLSSVCLGDESYAVPDGGEQELMRFIMTMDAPSRLKDPEARSEQTKRKQEAIAEAAQRVLKLEGASSQGRHFANQLLLRQRIGNFRQLNDEQTDQLIDELIDHASTELVNPIDQGLLAALAEFNGLDMSNDGTLIAYVELNPRSEKVYVAGVNDGQGREVADQPHLCD